MKAWLRRVRLIWGKDRLARDLREEMELHLALRARQMERGGVERATYAARRQFGNVTAIQEASSDMWGSITIEGLAQECRYAFRALRKTPGFMAVAVLTLACGLGINSAIFSVVNAVVLRALPYGGQGDLVALWEERTGAERPRVFNSSGTPVGNTSPARRTTVSVANLTDYRKQSRSFEGFAAYDRVGMNLTGNGRPERVIGEAVETGFFDVLSSAPAMGRAFLPEDGRPGAPRVVVLSHRFWEQRFGSDKAALERTVNLDGHAYQVVGVLGENFRAPSEFVLKDRVEYFVPAIYPPEQLLDHGSHEVNAVARLRSGIQLSQAQADLDQVSTSLSRQYPSTNANLRAAIGPLRNDLVRGVRDSLMALLGASGFVVLITCVNVANLLLVRAVARRHECSVRLALGAGRARMIRQFLMESVLLSAAGCAAGLALGRVLLRVLVVIAPPGLANIETVTMDWRVFGVSAALATLTGLLFGMAPAWQASQAKPVESLKGAARLASGISQSRWRTMLTVAEVGLALVLMVGAGLLLKSFVLLSGVDLGFQADRVLAMNVALPDKNYPTPADRLRFFEQLEERVAGIPGVEAVAYSNRMPLRGGWGTGVTVDGNFSNDAGDADCQAVSPGYFRTLGIPLVKGRLLTPADRTGAAYAGVVNQAFVRQYLKGAEPLGRQFRRSNAPWITIVGVVNDIRRGGKTAQIRPQVYLPAAQTELYPVRLADFAVRSAGDPRRLTNSIQEMIWTLDKDQPITSVRTLEEIVTASAAQRRFETILLMVFAAVALGLAVIGIFGVLSFAVSQRTPELGIRIALGAAPAKVLGLVLRQAGTWIATGIVLGLGGALVVTRYVESLLFGIERTDWKTYAAAVALLGLIAVAAALVPARRGSRVDPMVALRTE